MEEMMLMERLVAERLRTGKEGAGDFVNRIFNAGMA